MKDETSQRRGRRLAFLVAVLLSLLLHQVVLTVLMEHFGWNKPEPEGDRELLLVEAAPPPAEEPPAVEEAPVPAVRPLPPALPPLRPPRPREEAAGRPEAPAPGGGQAGESEVAGPPAMTAGGTPNSGPRPSPSEAPRTPKLDMDWRSFESAFAETVAVERDAYTDQSLERRRGTGSFKPRLSGRVLQALGNNKGFAGPGGSEPLGPRQRIFHNYINNIHDARIHPLFADGFLASLGHLGAGDPLNDFDLHVVTEFEIFPDGRISEVRVVKSSGVTVFDAAAVDAIYRGSPFPAPPAQVLSWNNRAYLRWGFYRNARKCGAFNVEPFILRAPGATEEALPLDKFNITDG